MRATLPFIDCNNRLADNLMCTCLMTKHKHPANNKRQQVINDLTFGGRRQHIRLQNQYSIEVLKILRGDLSALADSANLNQSIYTITMPGCVAFLYIAVSYRKIAHQRSSREGERSPFEGILEYCVTFDIEKIVLIVNRWNVNSNIRKW